jgi:pilus assembly protein Flp/PilA
MLQLIRRIATAKARDDEGASAVEYGLLVAAIAAIIILVVFAVGSWVKGAFKDTCTAFSTSGSVNRAGAASTQSCDS